MVENQLHSPKAMKKWANILTDVAICVERIKVLFCLRQERSVNNEFGRLVQ